MRFYHPLPEPRVPDVMGKLLGWEAQRKQNALSQLQAEAGRYSLGRQKTVDLREDQRRNLEQVRRALKALTPANYGAVLQAMRRNGMDVSEFPAEYGPEAQRAIDEGLAAANMMLGPSEMDLFKKKAEIEQQYEKPDKVTMSKRNEDGTVSEIEALPDEVKRWQKEGYRRGELRGTPKQPDKVTMSKRLPDGTIHRVEVEPDKVADFEQDKYVMGELVGKPEETEERIRKKAKAKAEGTAEGKPDEIKEITMSKLRPDGRISEVKVPASQVKAKEQEGYEIGVIKGTPKDFDNKLSIAAQAVGVSPEKLKSGELTTEEAAKIAEEYQKKFGTESFLKMIFGGAQPQPPATQHYDETGKRIK